MGKKTKNSKVKKIVPKNNGTYCTECGDELLDFAFKAVSSNKKEVLKKHYNCVKTGKFSGEFCSKLFISDDTLLNEFLDNKD